MHIHIFEIFSISFDMLGYICFILQNVVVEKAIEPRIRVTVAMGANRSQEAGKC